VATQPSFLTAEWRDLVMLNYEIEPAALASRVPSACELDTWNGRSFVSLVGFRFLDTRVRGVAVPFHRDFLEVNLRFYVRRPVGREWRRGVVFVKELVPRRAIAWVANLRFGERYAALPMRDESARAGEVATIGHGWRRAGRWEGLSAQIEGKPSAPADDAEETFITEHYWGYSGAAGRPSLEYQVEHPRWNVWRATSATLRCDVASLYGAEFVESLSGAPTTAFVADGSPVVVRKGVRLP
jgi:uncharacterized protein YqjF (DUF2071 family)